MPGPLASSHVAAYNQCAGLVGMIAPEDLADENGVFSLTPGGSHVLWLLGHLALSAELLVGRRIGLAQSIPVDWTDLFNTGSKPVADEAIYPPYAELRAAAINSHKLIAEQIATMSEEALLAPMPDDFPLRAFAPDVDSFLSFGQLHSNYHVGQITMLLKAQGLKAGVGM